MKGFLNPDNPFNQFMVRIADLCIINVLMLFCSIPIFTIGAACAAAHKTTQDMVFDTGSGVVAPFFRAFKSNFKQSTVVWLITLFLGIVVFLWFFLISVYFTGTLRTIGFILLGIGAFLLLALNAYMYPLMVRYENTLKQHLHNTILLILFNFPRTLGMVAVNLIPFLLLYFFTGFFIRIAIFWLLMGFAFIILINSYLVKPILEDLEEKQALAEAKAAEEASKKAEQAEEDAPEQIPDSPEDES